MSTAFDVLILELSDFRNGFKIFVYHGSEYPKPFAMKDSDFPHIKENSIVNKLPDYFHSFFTSFSPDINLLLEVCQFVIQIINN